MRIPVCIIEKFEYVEGKKQYDTIPVYLTSFTSVSLNYGYKDKRDTFGITLIPTKTFNSNTQTDVYNVPNIDNNDVINIYVYYEDDPNIVWDTDGVTVLNLNDFLLFNGVVDKFSYGSNQGVYTMSVTGNNRTEILLNSMVFFQYTQMIVPNMIVESAGKFRSMNKNKALFMFKDYKGDGTDIAGSEPQAYNALNVNYYDSYIPNYEHWGKVPRGGVRAYKRNAYEQVTVDGVTYWRLKKYGDDGVTPINLNEKDSDGNWVYRFPKLQYYETYKTLYSHLDVLSGPSYTYDREAGTYITYVTRDNVLHWDPKKTIVDRTALESETSSTRVNREIRDVINAVVINVGHDVRGKGILALAYDSNSMVKYGAKWKYITRSNIAEQVKNDQRTKSGVVYNDENNFPASYPVNVFVPGQSSILDSSTGSPIWEYDLGDTISSNLEFNDYIRKVSRELGKDYGRDYIAHNGNPRFFVNMKLDEGSDLFRIGDFVQIEVPSLNWDGLDTLKLRVQEIKHTIDSNGWSTQLTLEEDAENVI